MDAGRATREKAPNPALIPHSTLADAPRLKTARVPQDPSSEQERDARAIIGLATSKTFALPPPASSLPATPSAIARLRTNGDPKKLATQILTTVNEGIVRGAEQKLRKKKYLDFLQGATSQIALDTVQRLTPRLDAGEKLTKEEIQDAVSDAVDKAIQNMPSVFRAENIVSASLWTIGQALNYTAQILLLANLPEVWTEPMKLVAASGLGIMLNLALSMFKPHFEEKMSNQTRAINYDSLKWALTSLGEAPEGAEQTQPIDPRVQKQFGEIYIAHQSVDARFQGVLGLMIQCVEFLGDAFFKARYILDDTKHPGAMEDACELIANVFINSRLVFYSVKPEFKMIFDSFVYSVLRPMMRKHAREHGEEMYDRIIAKVRGATIPPSEESIKKYYDPFIRGVLDLEQAESYELADSVKDILRTRAEEEEAKTNKEREAKEAATKAKKHARRRKLWSKALPSSPPPATEAKAVPPSAAATTSSDAVAETSAPAPLAAVLGLSPEETMALAVGVMKAIDRAIIESSGQVTRKGKRLKHLRLATGEIALDTVSAIAQQARAGDKPSDEALLTAAKAAVTKALKNEPKLLRAENVLSASMWTTGHAINYTVQIALLLFMPKAWSDGVKLIAAGGIGTVLNLVLAMFKPHFDDKVNNQSKALNFDLMKRAMTMLGKEPEGADRAQAIDETIAKLLGEIYIAHQSVEGRIQSILGLMMGFCQFINNSFFRALYMLNDEAYEHRMEDACELMAGIFIGARTMFYALKPEFTLIFEAFVYSVLRPTLRKHAREHGQQMYELIMKNIRNAKIRPDEESMKKYYDPFVRGALGLSQLEAQPGVVDELKSLLEARA